MERVLTRNIHKENSQSVEVYEAGGGYAGLRKAVTSMSPVDVVEAVKKSGLRGRGGAGFPAGLKWSFMPAEKTKKHYLLCNADESEPGTFKDRLLMEQDPHMVLEGCMLGAYAMQADACYIYIRGEFGYSANRVAAKRRLRRPMKSDTPGKNVVRKRLGLRAGASTVGAGAYICGEETALMSSLEGDRGLSTRFKPPFPAQSGVWGRAHDDQQRRDTVACVPDDHRARRRVVRRPRHRTRRTADPSSTVSERSRPSDRAFSKPPWACR